ncbi:MAG: nicotinate-nucleotide adenylyltransferase [Geitlerinemataceae cyanobacterium]
MNIALFGTSADPPSVGHRAVVRWLAARFDRVAVWASDNPFKPDRTPLERRMEMLRLMVETLRSGRDGAPCHNVECCPELSHMRSLVSVQRAREHWPEARFSFAVGSDLVPQLPNWYRAADLLHAADLVAIPRPGYPLDPEAIATLRQWGTVTIADVEGPAISSSAYRATRNTDAIPEPVAAYIAEQNLYGTSRERAAQRAPDP